MTLETTVIDDYRQSGLLMAYQSYLSDSRYCLMDQREFEKMLREYEAATPKPDFWEWQKAWFKEIQRLASGPAETSAERAERRREVFGENGSNPLYMQYPSPEEMRANVMLVVAEMRRRRSE